jgi:hypothetical protein
VQADSESRNKNEEIIPVHRLTPTVCTDPPAPATTTRTCTVKQRTFFTPTGADSRNRSRNLNLPALYALRRLAPTLGIGVGTWICLHYTRTLRRVAWLQLPRDSVPQRHENYCSAPADTINIIYCKGNYNKGVTKGVLLVLQVTVYFAYIEFKCNWNHNGFYTVTTIRVDHSSNYGNIIRVLSSVNSSISDYKGH